MKKVLLILTLFPTLLFSQRNLPLNREFTLFYEKEGATLEYLRDTTYAYRPSEFPNAPIPNDSLKDLDESTITLPVLIEHPILSCFKPYITVNPSVHKPKTYGKLLPRKLKRESLFIVNDTTDKFYLTLDPLFNFVFDNRKEALYNTVPLSINTRGFLIRSDIGKNLSFETSFYENQATFAKYIDDNISSTNNLFSQSANYDVIPGQGRAKTFKKNGYDYAMAAGYVSYSPFKILNIQVGHGKHFVGDGYRSLLLSDNAFNYPYARITTSYKNIQYTNLYTSFMNLTDGGVKTPLYTERLFQKKIGSFQMLSMNLLKCIRIGLFQGMIWEAADSTNRQYVNFNTFNPIIGVNTAIFGLHNKNNMLLGLTLKLKITRSISFYGQYMLDDTYSKNNGGDIRNKYGYQAGFKYFDLFTIKNLHVQAEYNLIRPYAYAAAYPQQSYTHYNQALAHPLGANFKEVVGFINYRLKDFFIEIKLNYAVKGTDSSFFNSGDNAFKSDSVFPVKQDLSNIHTTQGLKTTITNQDVHIGYLVNPSTNFNIIAGISNRIAKTNKTTSNTQFVYLGIRTSLSNFYYDF